MSLETWRIAWGITWGDSTGEGSVRIAEDVYERK